MSSLSIERMPAAPRSSTTESAVDGGGRGWADLEALHEGRRGARASRSSTPRRWWPTTPTTTHAARTSPIDSQPVMPSAPPPTSTSRSSRPFAAWLGSTQPWNGRSRQPRSTSRAPSGAPTSCLCWNASGSCGTTLGVQGTSAGGHSVVGHRLPVPHAAQALSRGVGTAVRRRWWLSGPGGPSTPGAPRRSAAPGPAGGRRSGRGCLGSPGAGRRRTRRRTRRRCAR